MKKLLLGLSLLCAAFIARPASAHGGGWGGAYGGAYGQQARWQHMTPSCARAVINAARFQAACEARDVGYHQFILMNFYQDPSSGLWMVGFSHHPYESVAHVAVGPGCRILGIEVYDDTDRVGSGA